MIQVAQALGVEQYARFDLFYHRHTRDIIIIEVNTLPGLTASTVLFHQLILEDISPQEFFAWVVDRKNQPQRVTSQKISQDGIAQLR
jgi:D-alanine-D-alanine ligase-like ATP-grasp enzyme